MAVTLPTEVRIERERSRRRKQVQVFTVKGIAILILAALGAFMLFPAVWMLSTALKTDAQVFSNSWIPNPPRWQNFADAWRLAPFPRYFLNTSLYTMAVVFGTVLSCSLAAFGFAKLRFPGRDALFVVLLATMMLPGMVTMIPQFILFTSVLKWGGTYLPLIVPSFFAGAFFTFLLRQFFMGIPEELLEAARIDGASEFWIWRKVMLPLSQPALATVAIFAFEGAWNTYVAALLYLQNEQLYTVQVGLQFFKIAAQTQWNYLMAAGLFVMLPIILLFVIFQKYFIEGASIQGGLKG